MRSIRPASTPALLSLVAILFAAHLAVGQAAVAVPAGQSAVALNGPWKFHTGDDPRWADPNFDDSSWQDYLIDPMHPHRSAVEALDHTTFPGWQNHDHPGYTGYAWYRIRVENAGLIENPALLIPGGVDDAWEVYVNGKASGGFGRLGPHPIVYAGRSRLFPLSDTPAAITIALRVWCLRNNALPDAKNLNGGLHGIPVFGSITLLEIFQRNLAQQERRLQWQLTLLLVSYGTVGLISLFLFLSSRSQREYLWAGVAFLLSATSMAIAIALFASVPIPALAASSAAILLQGVSIFAGILAIMYLLDIPRTLWRRLNLFTFAIVLLHFFLSSGLLTDILPPRAALGRARDFTFICLLVAPALLAIGMAVDALRTHGRKAWLPLTPVLLFAVGMLAQLGSFLVSTFLMASVPAALLLIFLARFVRQQHENASLLEDVQQAQAIQQLLIPETPPAIPGLTIESDYRPAREVGGDFFQILPDATDGSVLIVVGDVTGKGLQAGMMVALIVGAIRTEATHTRDPLRLLTALNQRVCGRGQANATCQALHITSAGVATLANAGHLPPYRNGIEVPIEGALPLGILMEAEFPVHHFRLDPADTLVLMSDGLAEAQDTHGHLFGFDRIAAMLQRGYTPYELANAAQGYGQEDDILVLRVTRDRSDPIAAPPTPAFAAAF